MEWKIWLWVYHNKPRDTEKAKLYSIIKQGAIETTKDPQEIVADGFEMGLEKDLMAYTVGHPKFFLENWNKLHGGVWAKMWLDTNFQPIWMSFDHASEAPKLAIFKAF